MPMATDRPVTAVTRQRGRVHVARYVSLGGNSKVILYDWRSAREQAPGTGRPGRGSSRVRVGVYAIYAIYYMSLYPNLGE